METKSNFLIGVIILAVALAAVALGMSITNVNTGGDLQTQIVGAECYQPFECFEGTWSCAAEKCVGGITPIFENRCISDCAGGNVGGPCRIDGQYCDVGELDIINKCASACADLRRVFLPPGGGRPTIGK